MTIDRKTLFRRLLILPPLIVGIAIVAIAVRGRDAPERTPPKEVARKVRVIPVPRLTVIPRALGYGNVQPGMVWNAVAEVPGKIIETHPQLKRGAILPKGAVLLRIDPTDYQLAIDRIGAEIRGAQAQLAEIAAREGNTQASLAIENRSLGLNTRELERKRQLAKTRAVSRAAVDQEERNLLARRQSVQTLKNALNLLPAERARLQAGLAGYRAQMADARLDLERTVIIAPFDARIAKVNVERTQFAGAGQVLATADSIDVSEVSAQLPIDRMFRLIAPAAERNFDARTVMADLDEILGLTPIVRLRSGTTVSTWKGRVARVSDTVDPRTRTVGIIVAVDAPYRQSAGNFRPPLAKNMFVEVELRGRARPGQIVIPRTALHQGRVYLVGDDSRLRFAEIEVLFTQGDLVVVKSGLEAGRRIVVTDLFPAIGGMLLDPVPDDDAAQALAADAAGEGALR